MYRSTMMSEWYMWLLMSLPVQMPARSIRDEKRWNLKSFCNLSVPHPLSHPLSLLAISSFTLPP